MTLLRAFSLLLVSGSGASRGDLVGGLEPRVAWLLRLQTRPLELWAIWGKLLTPSA